MSDPDTELIKTWQKDPLKFCDEALLLPVRNFILTDDEKQAFRELAKLVNAKMKASFVSVKSGKTKLTEEEMTYSKKRGISIMAGRGNGKSTFVALAIIWFFFCFPMAVIPCTATNAPQLENVIWRNISSLLSGDPAIPASKSPIKNCFVITKQKVVLKGSERESQYVVARTVNIKGSSDEQTETLSGFHSDFMMFVVDEASGVPNPVFVPIERTQTGKINFAILIFNPTRRTGYALDTHYNAIEKHRWVKLQWNAEKSPIVSSDHIDFMREKYGIDSDAYRVNVLGLPPKSGSGSLIPWEWVDNAIDKSVEINENFPVIMGVDIARSGDDDTAMCIRRHKKILPIITYHGLDSREVAQKVEAVRAIYEVDYVFLDIIGVGSGVWDLLKVNNWVYAFQASWGADNLHPYFKFYRLLDEIAWRVREQFQNGNISIPNDTVLKDELSSRQWDPGDDRKDGKAKIESKQLMKKRGLHSPNRADALMMCYRYPDEYYLNQDVEDEDENYYSSSAQSTVNIHTGY